MAELLVSNMLVKPPHDSHAPVAREVKHWDDASAAELRAESMKRGLPESCDRREVLQMCLGHVEGWLG